jgi:chemotaxis protein CheD
MLIVERGRHRRRHRNIAREDRQHHAASHRQAAFDRGHNARVFRLLPGEAYVTGIANEMIVTVLGSCVAACIRDPINRVGGMNHFMLPESQTGEWGNVLDAALRYGNFAMEALINEVLKFGGRKENLEVKLFGGANFGAGPLMVGRRNTEFALRYLEAERLSLVAQDLGGWEGRRIHYFPATGKVTRLLLRKAAERELVQVEQRYGSNLRRNPLQGEIVLFDQDYDSA